MQFDAAGLELWIAIMGTGILALIFATVIGGR